MRGGLKLFRIFGIEITIDWSWIFIFLLVSWSLAAGWFPQIHPDWSPELNWGVAITAALLFFVSVLAHELAHSLVAKSKGLPVKNITLFLFGGVSNIEREPQSAGIELVMAIVGPLTSIGIGVIILLIVGARANLFTGTPETLKNLDPVTTLLAWLGPVNLIVGVFNMIPGFPLDGGRVLRSILWITTRDLQRATRWASWVGQTIAWLFIVGGISMVFGTTLPLFGTGVVSGLWLAFIGWFLNNAAAASYQQVLLHNVLEGVPVTRLMRQNVPTVPPDEKVGDLVHDWLINTDERAFPVIEADRLAGLVCLEDVRKLPKDQWDTVSIQQIMTPVDKLLTLGPTDDAAEAMTKLSSKDVRQLPVVDGGRLLGLLRRRDILRYLQLHVQPASV
ncbi:MAG TPA: site-2 protease family protein [Blastocatellia bacterium]